MFIMKYCQIENPYVQDGTRITVSPPDCAKAAKDLGSECSCGKIAFVGWDWDKAADNIWDTSSINAQVLAEYMGAGGKVPQMKSDSPTRANLAKSPAPGSTPTSAPASSPKTQRQMEAAAPAAGAATLAADKRAPYTPLTHKDRYAMNLAGTTSRLAFAGRKGSNKVPATVVDRAPQGAPTWGMDSLNQDAIPEFEKQDDRYAFWGREGGWRNICGPRQHPMWDPEQKKFYSMKVGQASNYVKHWCTCFPSGNVEIETKQGADTMGCEQMYEAGSNMKSVTTSPGGDERKMGRDSSTYETTAPGYKYQRVMDRHDDLRWDERYPSFVEGNGGDRGIWMDENDAGPAPIIDDYSQGKLWAPKRQELMNPSNQGNLPLNGRERVYNDAAKQVLPWDTARGSSVHHETRGYIKTKAATPRAALSSSSSSTSSSSTSKRGMWADDVDALMDVDLVKQSASQGKHAKGPQQKVIVDAWGRPLTHYPTSSDYPSGSGDYDTEVPKVPSAKSVDVGEEAAAGEGLGGEREGVAKASAAKAAALRAAADAAEAVAEAANEKVGTKLLHTLQHTASEAEAVAQNIGDVSAATQLHVHINPPGMEKTDSWGQVIEVDKTRFVHLNPPGKRHTDDSGQIVAVQGQTASAHNSYDQPQASNTQGKLPWSKGTADFHNHMNGRVHPRNPHPAEEVDIRAKDIKTTERQTPMTGWGLERDRYGRATEIGYGGGFHGAGHFPVVDSRTRPMGGTADRPWKASVDDPAPPSPRIWSWQGVTNPAEDAIDMRRHGRRGSFPDTPAQGWAGSTEASWREQDPEEQDYSWQLGRGLGGRDEDPEDDESLGVH